MFRLLGIITKLYWEYIAKDSGKEADSDGTHENTQSSSDLKYLGKLLTKERLADIVPKEFQIQLRFLNLILTCLVS